MIRHQVSKDGPAGENIGLEKRSGEIKISWRPSMGYHDITIIIVYYLKVVIGCCNATRATSSTW